VKDSLTGQELINYLKKSCKDSDKLFIPDSPRQDAVAESLVEHYDSELLLSSIDYYVKSKIGPFLLFDFAIESKKITDKVKKEKESKDKFLQIMRETHDRMVNE
jgi:hypothetical protein